MKHATRAFLAAAVAVGLTGCGREKYEARYETNTLAYFDVAKRVAESLGGEVREGKFSFRAPKQFVLVPGKAKKDAPDPRLPLFLRLPLPGLAAAWQSEVQVISAPAPAADGGPSASAELMTSRAYCFLLSEAAMKQKGGDTQFDVLVVNRVLGGLGLEPKTSREIGDGLARETHGYGRFGRQLKYDKYQFQTNRIERRAQSLVSIYIYRGRPSQAAVVLITPVDVARGEALNTRVPLSLASLESASASGPAI